MTDRISTHADGCWSWGHGHYECAVGKIEHLQAEVEKLLAEALKYEMPKTEGVTK